jgi:hypothetical protein
MARYEQKFIENPRFAEYPYYGPYKHDFVVIGCYQEPGYTTQEFMNTVRAWLAEHCVYGAAVSGYRVSFNDTTDAMAFRLTWG